MPCDICGHTELVIEVINFEEVCANCGTRPKNRKRQHDEEDFGGLLLRAAQSSGRKKEAATEEKEEQETKDESNVVLFDEMCKDENTFLGCIPQDINGLLRPMLTFVPKCGVCERETNTTLCELIFSDKKIEASVCRVHSRCDCWKHGKSNHKVFYVHLYTEKDRKPYPHLCCPNCHPFTRYHRQHRFISTKDKEDPTVNWSESTSKMSKRNPDGLK